MLLSEAISLISHSAIVSSRPTVWADLGAGEGLFSFALARLLAPGSTIYAVDKNKVKLSVENPADIAIIPFKSDLEKQTPNLPPLDGIIAANVLHFIRDQKDCLKRLHSFCKPDAVYIIVEYDTGSASQWIPYPLPFSALSNLFGSIGRKNIKRVGQIQSKYNSSFIYAAVISI